MYDQGSLRHEARAQKSAELVISALRAFPVIRSVADFGCGKGVWLNAWDKTGAAVVGLDGEWTQAFRGDPKWFLAADLTQPIDLGRAFDLVQSLEVAEHLPAQSAETFVNSLTRHGPVILFSAAPPGQGGENHVNEQPPDYWRDLFAARGYRMYDFIRPQLVGTDASDWYRCNTFLYVRDGTPLTADVAATFVHGRIRDFASAKWRLRKFIVRFLLPKFTWNVIARRRFRGATT